MRSDAVSFPPNYPELLARLKDQVRSAQLRAQRVASTELLRLYWTIGAELLSQQKSPSWEVMWSAGSLTTCAPSSPP